MVVRTLLLGLVISAACAQGQVLSRLSVGEEVYTNVSVLSVTATDIYFTHSAGFGNAKLSELESALQKRFHFDPKKAAAEATLQRENHARYVEALMNAPKPEKRMEESPSALAINIAASDPSVSYEYYNMGQPKPAEIAPGMLGNTRYNFECQPLIKWDPIPKKAGAGFLWRIQEVNISLSLPIKITMPQGVTAPLRSHEEGHRQICEHYYALGTQAIRHLGEVMRVREFYSREGDLEKAIGGITTTATGMIRYSYWNYAQNTCKQANVYYDQITDHGRNGMNPKEGVAKAIAQFEPEWSRQPAWTAGTTKNTLSAK